MKNDSNSKLFKSLKKGLNEAIDYSDGNSTSPLKQTLISVPKLPNYKGKDIKSIRTKLHLTQSVFANTLGVSEKTVEAWESGRNTPQGPAQRMLFVLKNNSNPLDILGIKVG
ncbi:MULTISPECIES: helix-turn-helix domain-containing protein [Leptospira]|uniref:Helix-turn-helix domain-containing protein n=1 Tax=Leptospira bandrabouensis TaxID=2484903 RepID=A0A6H3NPS0_9LEPT|nr:MULTISPECIES: helix-turn-helix domain-containing protein [Leptospira]MCG6142786.1 helix-turn-helix domain-containing protein [Leptospira mtsangambouensis]MCG6146521.1 helix-turn-helix domain-containing protein [Leptospira bandrabouensis]MCG6154075.1 helix-turn-helix domain-containing protein [Leptospira bandrabouensis]MCG6161893.1 helix-turn-helix domain-containing protein [Leptospira bandrabouensis]MCG6166141.1 helix-turn-helix domain-containing protein [Leptospira bandrabouensis]